MAQTEERLQQTRNQEILFKYNEFLETVRQLSRTAAADRAQISLLKTRNSALKTRPQTLPPGITPELLQQILPRLDQRPVNQPKTANRKLETANGLCTALPSIASRAIPPSPQNMWTSIP
jgi:hypothetical protein